MVLSLHFVLVAKHFESIVEKLTYSVNKIDTELHSVVGSGCYRRDLNSFNLPSNDISLTMLQQKVLLAISGVRKSYLLRKLLSLHIGGRTSMQKWQLVVKMAPTWNFILQVCKFFGSFVIYKTYYTSSVSKFEIKSKSICVCDNRNVFKCVLFVTEFWSCLKSETFSNFSWQLRLHKRVCVCVWTTVLHYWKFTYDRGRKWKDTINHTEGTVRGNPNVVAENRYVNHCVYIFSY